MDERTATNPGDSLHLAAKCGKAHRVAACLASDHDLNGLDERGQTALFVACVWGRIKVCRTLLRAGADVNFRTPEGTSPLDVVLQTGFSELLRLLLWAGADLKSTGERASLRLKLINALM